jgi:hypothetical protein
MQSQTDRLIPQGQINSDTSSIYLYQTIPGLVGSLGDQTQYSFQEFLMLLAILKVPKITPY